MKTTLRLLILVFLVSGCAGNRYLLTDKGKDKRFLVDSIDKLAKVGEVSRKPMLVIDGTPYRYGTELKTSRLQLEKADIKQIMVLKKSKAVNIYGEDANVGALVITTKASPQTSKSFKESKILLLLDGQEISKEEMEKIDPDGIDAIDVIKNKETVKEYTSGDYDGVILIRTKKKKEE